MDTTLHYDYGLVGLGTMGRNLALNISDHGFSLSGFDRDKQQVELLNKETSGRKIFATEALEEFIHSLKQPKIIMLLVPAGDPVDQVISDLMPLLSENDLLMDCGNSHYIDTDARAEALSKAGIWFMGIGISGGEEGARNGPSIMPGGEREMYKKISGLLEAIAAKANTGPCVAWIGPRSAGHYVKMVHNGIEYGLMQLIAETYHVLKMMAGYRNEQLRDIYGKWNKGLLNSFLLGITADIFDCKDELGNHDLIDMILDKARQKGTGGWASQDASKLQIPIPVIDIAVSMRDLSDLKHDRLAAAQILQGPANNAEPTTGIAESLEQALHCSMVVTYIQGVALMQAASKVYGYGLKLEDITRIWCGGCIIRSAILEDIHHIFSLQPGLTNLLLDHGLAGKLGNSQNGLRQVVQAAVQQGIPVPAMMAALSYYDSYRSGWLPANLIQAQRDNFGAHTYERTDREGVFHTQWSRQ